MILDDTYSYPLHVKRDEKAKIRSILRLIHTTEKMADVSFSFDEHTKHGADVPINTA